MVTGSHLARLPSMRPVTAMLSWQRLSAFLIDQLLVGLVLLPLVALRDMDGFLMALGEGVGETSGLGFERYPWLYVAVYLSYFTVCEGRWGQTAGARLRGLLVVNIDGGGRLSYRSAFIRALARPIAVLTTGSAKGGRGLHDKWAHAQVMDTRSMVVDSVEASASVGATN